MNSVLPPIPNVVFTILEPLSLVAGFVGACVFPETFTADQIANTPVRPLSQNTLMLSLQLGNLYLLMAFVGIGILYYTTDPTIVRNYVIALALGDVGHLVTTYMGMGHEGFVDLTGWNGNGWGNIGATAVLFATRMAYLFGLLGSDRGSNRGRNRVPARAAKKRA